MKSSKSSASSWTSSSTSSAWRALALVVGATLLTSCSLFRYLGLGGDDAHWQERRYRDVNAASVLELAQSAFSKQFPRGGIDVLHGHYESGWSYGRIAEGTHDALRQRVVVETKSQDQTLLVRLRVQQESSETASRVGDPRANDWQPFVDDDQQAETAITRLSILLLDLATPVVDPAAKGEKGAKNDAK